MVLPRFLEEEGENNLKKLYPVLAKPRNALSQVGKLIPKMHNRAPGGCPVLALGTPKTKHDLRIHQGASVTNQLQKAGIGTRHAGTGTVGDDRFAAFTSGHIRVLADSTRAATATQLSHFQRGRVARRLHLRGV
jgi:hypothetical protein